MVKCQNTCYGAHWLAGEIGRDDFGFDLDVLRVLSNNHKIQKLKIMFPWVRRNSSWFQDLDSIFPSKLCQATADYVLVITYRLSPQNLVA